MYLTMVRHMLFAAALVCVAFVPDQLLAQETVMPGWRVRATTTGPEGARTDQYIGNVERATMETIFVRSGGQVIEIPMDDLVALEVSDGTSSSWQKGLLWGGVGGGMIGVIVGVANDSTDVLAALAIGAVGGGAIGAGVGALIKSEKWVRVPLMGDQASLGIRHNSLALLIPTPF